jgi:DNA-binding response OmpR family regulator
MLDIEDAGKETRQHQFSLGNLTIDLDTYRVSVDGVAVVLSPNEFDALRVFFGSPNRVLPYKSLTEAIWKAQGPREVRKLKVLIYRLRLKIAESFPYEIETVRGRGYGLLRSRLAAEEAS